MLYGNEFWVIKFKHINNMSVEDMSIHIKLSEITIVERRK